MPALWHYTGIMTEIKSDNASNSGKVRSGKARMEKLTAQERKELAQKAAAERWRKTREQEARFEIAPGNIPAQGKVWNF